jgi:2-polyprenyl-3-methyl-5-hydroxy-6-metoxy-1,4-benzoquinol methylase
MVYRQQCPLCCGSDISVKQILEIDQSFIKFIETYYGVNNSNLMAKYIDKEIKYVECKRCKLIYQQNILSQKGMYELYENLIDPKKSLEKRLSLNIKQNFRGILLMFNLIRKINKPIRDISIVDLGMGFGNMLSYAKALGCMNSFGVELSLNRVEYAKNNFGITSYPSLESFEDGSIDLIISNQSLEHIPDVRANLDLIEKKLSLGGITYIAVPNSSKEKVFLRKGAFQPLEHINSFIPKSKNFLFSESMKHQIMLKNFRIGSGTIWLFKKVTND